MRRSDHFWVGLSTDLVIEQAMMKAIKEKDGLTHGRRMTESVRAVWVNSLHKRASVHNAINALIGTKVSHGDACHSDLGKTRIS